MPAKKTRTPEILRTARERLGFESLRPGQSEAVTALLDGHDTLVVQPTGSGKSAIYQLAGHMMEGATVIVSPLIALQKDQVDSIDGQPDTAAAALNSTQPLSEVREELEKVRHGEIDFFFLAPEQLRKPATLETLSRAAISLFVVDEAHCISEWGHDFRPDYIRLGTVIENLGHPRVLAMTATATARVRDEIVERLRMRNPRIFVQGFDRPNISLRVDNFRTDSEKRDALVHRVQWSEKPGIVYTGTRRAAEEIVEALAADGIDALFYHGGLKAKDRHRIQERFMEGNASVMVATNAFGLGIDKPDIRFVYHYDVPESLDSYYQEIGRAGRDGQPAEAALFFRLEDIGAQSFKVSEAKVDIRLLEQVVETIAEEQSVDPDSLAEEVGLSPRKLTTTLQRLEDAGAVETLADGALRTVASADPVQAIQLVAENQELRRSTKKERLMMMHEYAESSVCRRQILLEYFGESFEGPCGNCDNCEADASQGRVDPKLGTRREVA